MLCASIGWRFLSIRTYRNLNERDKEPRVQVSSEVPDVQSDKGVFTSDLSVSKNIIIKVGCGFLGGISLASLIECERFVAWV